MYITHSLQTLPRQNIMCPHCMSIFQVTQIKGSYLNRHCPKCDGVLSDKAFDASVQHNTNKLNRLNKMQNQLSKQLFDLDGVIKSQHKHKWYDFILCRLRQYKRSRYVKGLNGIQKEKEKLNQANAVWALSRYYSSEWFLLTGICLDGYGKARFSQKDACALTVSYQDGKLKLNASNLRTAGIAGEFDVFEQLIKQSKNKQSNLYGAVVLPRMFLPNYLTDANKSPWNEADCIVLTQKAALIIEVKNLRKDIVIDRSFEHIDVGINKNYDWVLRQSHKHVEAFKNTVSAYDASRIFEQVVFVQPKSFIPQKTPFYDNKNISYLSNKAVFIEYIEEALQPLDEVLSECELEELAQQLMTNCLDLAGDKSEIHAEKIKGEQRNFGPEGKLSLFKKQYPVLFAAH